MTSPFKEANRKFIWRRPCECGCGRMDHYKGDMQGYINFVHLFPKVVSTGFGGIMLRREPKTQIRNFVFYAN